MANITLTEEIKKYSSIINEKWDTETKTPKSKKGMWDGWSVSELKSELSRLKNKKEKTEADKTREKQVMFAIRAKQKNKWGKIKESSINEGLHKSLDDILAQNKDQVQEFIDGVELYNLEPLFQQLYEYYLEDMPYGVAKARTGDPDQWITERLMTYLGDNGYLPDDDQVITKPENVIDVPNPDVEQCNMMVGEEIADKDTKKDVVKEKWDTNYETPESKKGMFKGRTKASLRAELARLKKNPNKTEALKKKEKEINFALRAKNKFGKASESKVPGPFSKDGKIAKQLKEEKHTHMCRKCGLTTYASTKLCPDCTMKTMKKRQRNNRF